MWRCWFALVAGCGYNPSRAGSDAATSDGPDVVVDVPQGCFGTLFTVCPVTPPNQPHDFPLPIVIDTDQSPLCIATDPDLGVCVVAGTEISISSDVRAIGSKPLVLLASESIDIAGTLDVASRRGQMPGAGANPPACGTGTAPTNGTTIAFGGGHGGTLGGLGGGGGPGDPDGAGGIPAVVPAFVFHGGCRGAIGGNSQGQGGSGGGAVALIASGITISGTIHASGAGGDGTNIEGAGGSGGGSGGTIALDAPTIEVVTTGLLLAHGGGGGEGSGAALSDPGDDPSTITAAAGGSGNSDGGDGGAGATTSAGVNGNPPSVPPAGPSGGGGGGGGCGVIRATGAPTIAGTISPPAS